MDTRSPVQHALVLHKVEPDRGVARFYSLMEHGAEEFLRCNRWSADAGVEGCELPFQRTRPSFTMVRIARSGWSLLTRLSTSTYENSAPVRSSKPRIAHPRIRSRGSESCRRPRSEGVLQQPAGEVTV